jgi:hypothetical protein
MGRLACVRHHIHVLQLARHLERAVDHTTSRPNWSNWSRVRSRRKSKLDETARRGQRRIDSMLKRKHAEIEADQ